VFAVALDLTWVQFQRVLRGPKAPLIGLVAQYLILPSVAFAVGRMRVETPSIAHRLLLVTCCPARGAVQQSHRCGDHRDPVGRRAPHRGLCPGGALDAHAGGAVLQAVAYRCMFAGLPGPILHQLTPG
jgi:hypothetical protein